MNKKSPTFAKLVDDNVRLLASVLTFGIVKRDDVGPLAVALAYAVLAASVATAVVGLVPPTVLSSDVRWVLVAVGGCAGAAISFARSA
ncbi:MAG: hypothetical protein O9327_03315 [Polaromonas sp.]|nr:hypothetical protein [Polaromonas sp.]